MLRLVVIFIFLNIVLCDDTKVVKLDYGTVSGEKYWNGDFYEFYGVPYASIPTGRDRFKGPLPPKPWEGVLAASKKSTICHQCYFTGDMDEIMLDGDDDCLLINVLTPLVASEDNLLPVVVYIHSGAFSGGSGNMAIFHHLVRHDVVTVSFNYRLGALGFACLGNEEIPGNAGLKDQVAALRWIQDNIKKFGGDPKRVTLAGFSVGAAMAELLSFSKSTIGLFNKLILESGSAFSLFTINRDPIATAINVAYAIGYNGTESIEELTEFYLNAEIKDLAEKSVNYHLKNSTFGFAPCIENLHEGMEAILLESPIDVIKKGEQNDVAVLTGFSNMEGISRTVKFGTWREDMNKNFADFLPADLKFDSDKSRDDIVKAIKIRYFNDKEINAESLQNYVDYFSDSMFKYSIIQSAKLHATLSKRPVYLYEFSYLGKLNIEHNYMDRLKGASHRDQTAYVLDFFGASNNYKDLDMRERMTTMWTDFVKYENPTAFESSLITVKWLPYTNQKRNYLEINKKMLSKKDLFDDAYNFWNNIYEKYYWNPLPPKFVKTEKKKNNLKTQNDGKTNNNDKSNSSGKNDVKPDHNVKPIDDIDTNENVKHENIIKPDGSANLNDGVKTNSNAQLEEDKKLKTDVKPESNISSESDIKPKIDVKSNNNVKQKHDVKLDNDEQTKSDVKPNNDVKPKSDVKLDDIKPKNNIKSEKSKDDVKLSSEAKIDPKSDDVVKPKDVIKPNKAASPNESIKPKSDVKSNNKVKQKHDVKPIDGIDTNENVKHENIIKPDGSANLNDGVKTNSNAQLEEDKKLKTDVKPESHIRSQSDIKPEIDVKSNNNVKQKHDVKLGNDEQTKSDVKPNNDVKPKSDVKLDDIKPKNNIKSEKSKGDVKPSSEAKIDPKSDDVVKPKDVIKPDKAASPNESIKPKSDVNLDNNLKTNNEVESKTDDKSKIDSKSNNNIKSKIDVKPKIVEKPGNVEP